VRWKEEGTDLTSENDAIEDLFERNS
jgi:hypothetical protein